MYSRRSVLGSASAAAAFLGFNGSTAAVPASGRRAQNRYPTYVLVHGAFQGSWCWKRVRSSLQRRGNEVFTPTLTGLGDRSHLLSPSINLDTHIDDVVNLIRWEGLNNVVLCGHSYGGCVITGVAERVPERLGSLVYLDAVIPQDGQSLLDATAPENRGKLLELLEKAEDGWKVPPPADAALDVNEQDRAWFAARVTPHPLATFQQKLLVTPATRQVRDIRYILASKSLITHWNRPFADLARSRGWRTITIDSGHQVMLDKPDELVAELLLAGKAAVEDRRPSATGAVM
jgi:pimeloyl-ACP methyl ester carboxylesterase